MSYSAEVKEELAQHIPSQRHCRQTALAALLSCQGDLRPQDSLLQLQVPAEGGEASRKCFTLILKTVNISFELSAQWEKTARRAVSIPVSDDSYEALAALLGGNGDVREEPGDGTIREDFGPGTVREDLLQKACCRRSYLREMFLCIGSVSDPDRRYHLEFACGSDAQADQLMDVLRRLGRQPRLSRRKKYRIVYFKEAEEIVDVLNLMGAHGGLLKMENSRILKDIRNNLNRRVNCEAANIGKSVQAAQRQIEDIRFLERTGLLRKLPESLRIMAELRMEYPDISLQELGMKSRPPIGKSGVNHRLRRISEAAERLRGGENGEESDPSGVPAGTSAETHRGTGTGSQQV